MNSSHAVGSLRSLDAVRHDIDWKLWGELAKDAPPFVSPAFFQLTARLADGEPLIAEAWRGGKLVGVLPLALRGRELTALRSDHTPGYDYRGTAEGLAAVWRELERDARWDVMTLKNVPPDSLLATALGPLVSASGGRFVAKPGARHFAFELPGFESRMNPKFLANLRRCARKGGGIALESIATPTHADFRAALDLEAMAWKGVAGTAIGADARVAHLYEALTRLFGHTGRANLSFLRVKDERIALLFSVEDGRTFYALKIGYDPRHAVLSPGHLMVWAAAAAAEKRGLSTFDFVGREDDWKRKWTDHFAEQMTLTVYRGSPRGRTLHALREVIKPRVHLPVGTDLRAPLRHGCQRVDVVGDHSLVERVRGRVEQGFGIRTRLRSVLSTVTTRGEHASNERPRLGAPSRFAVGTWVRVKDAETIRATLDAHEKLRGLRFVPTQWEACGQTYRVTKHVRRMRDDFGRWRTISGTALLEGVTCAGHGPEPAGCGRFCPLMFRDDWLEAAEAPHREPGASFVGLHAHVLGLDEIRKGLDLFGRRDGLTFMPEMEAYAGHRFRVVGQLPKVFEYDQWVTPRSPIYLLEGLACSGGDSVTGNEGPCDRACALLWHSDWLVLEPAAGGAR